MQYASMGDGRPLPDQTKQLPAVVTQARWLCDDSSIERLRGMFVIFVHICNVPTNTPALVMYAFFD